MDSHPLFDERVVDLLRGVTDELVNSSPQASRRIDLVLRPGPTGNEIETTLTATYPIAPPPAIGRSRIRRRCGRVFALHGRHGPSMPAFQYCHRRNEDGNGVSMEPLLEW